MAKITAHGGPTDATLGADDVELTEQDVDTDDTDDPGDAAKPGDPVAVDGDGESEEDGDAASAYADWSYNELQGELKDRSLPATGSRAELEKRLVEHDQAADG